MSSQHEHYPVTDEERRELYEDLRDFAGLNRIEAVETVGYAVGRQVCGCEQTGPLMAMLIINDTFPFIGKREPQAFRRGVELGYQALKEAQHV